MNEQLIIYLWSISENIERIMLSIGLFFLGGVPVILSIHAEVNNKGDLPLMPTISSVLIGLFFIVACNLIPSKQDLALIITYPYLKNGVTQVVESNTTTKLLQVSNKYLDNLIKDLESR